MPWCECRGRRGWDYLPHIFQFVGVLIAPFLIDYFPLSMFSLNKCRVAFASSHTSIRFAQLGQARLKGGVRLLEKFKFCCLLIRGQFILLIPSVLVRASSDAILRRLICRFRFIMGWAWDDAVASQRSLTRIPPDLITSLIISKSP